LGEHEALPAQEVGPLVGRLRSQDLVGGLPGARAEPRRAAFDVHGLASDRCYRRRHLRTRRTAPPGQPTGPVRHEPASKPPVVTLGTACPPWAAWHTEQPWPTTPSFARRVSSSVAGGTTTGNPSPPSTPTPW